MDSPQRVIKVGILTVSDSCFNGRADDKSGDNLKSIIESGNCFRGTVVTKDIIPDEQDDIKAKLLHWSDHLKLDVIFTTGGTGFSSRDVTPEATKAVIDKEAMGMTIAMMKGSLEITPLAMLSRLVCGIRGRTLILNLPGSSKGSAECLQIVAVGIPHAVDLLHDHNSDIKTTHAALQAEGVKAVHAHASNSDNSSVEEEKQVGSSNLIPSFLLKHLKNHGNKPTSLSSKDNLNQMAEDDHKKFGISFRNFFEYLEREIIPPAELLDCDKNQSMTQPNEVSTFTTKLAKVWLSSFRVLVHSLGLPDQISLASFLPQLCKVVESEFDTWMNKDNLKQYDESLMHTIGTLQDKSSSNCGSRGINRLFSPQEIPDHESESVNFVRNNMCSERPQTPSVISSAYQNESHFSKPYIKHYLPNESDHRFDSSNKSTVPCYPKTFQYGGGDRNVRTTHSYCNVDKYGSSPHHSNYSSPSLNTTLTRDIRHLDHHTSTSHLGENNIQTKSKQMAETISLTENVMWYPYETQQPIATQNFSTSTDKTCVNSLCTEELKDQLIDASKRKERDGNRWYKKYVCIGEHNKSCNMPASNFKNSSLSVNTTEEVKKSIISTSIVDTSSKDCTTPSTCASQSTIRKDDGQLGFIKSAKIHNMNNSGELVYVSVGKAFNCFVSDHHALKGICLHKGKRDIKKQFVSLCRQGNNTSRTTCWKRGKEVLERNRLDDYFQLTVDGMKEQKQVHCGKKRDQYVVNWYMWCPGHGNCKRKCGGFGKCIENCKGMLHKQDRHNCSLMVNLKLFLSDLSSWRVHITGSHIPDPNHLPKKLGQYDRGQQITNMNSAVEISNANQFGHAENIASNHHESTGSGSILESTLLGSSFMPSSSFTSLHDSHDNNSQVLQSKIPSKKRISKMLSSLKRRRNNRHYGLLKTRVVKPSLTTNDMVPFKNETFNKMDKKHGSKSQEFLYSNSEVISPTSNNASSLLNEFSCFLPENCVNDLQKNLSVNESINDLTTITCTTSEYGSVASSSITSHASLNNFDRYIQSKEYFKGTTAAAAAAENVSTGVMHIDSGLHPNISVSDFHQPFLHDNSLSEILTEASVNMSDQFDEFNSFIDLSTTDVPIAEIEQSKNVHVPLQSSKEAHLSSLSLVSKTSSNFTNGGVPDCFYGKGFFDNSADTSKDNLPSYREAAAVLAKQKRLHESESNFNSG